MFRECLKFLFILITFIGLSKAGFISIVGPRTVQLGNDYTVFLSSMSYSGDEKLELKLVGHKVEEDIDTQIIELGHLNETVTFDLSVSSTIQNYTLTATIASEKFEQSVDIFTIPKRYSIFVQTDKPVYKPGDVIKYRVLIIDSEMKPYKVEKVTVELIDSFGDVMNKVETKNIKKSADDGDEKEEDSAEDNKRDEKEIGSQEDKKEEDENSDDENKVLPKFEAKLELGVISGQFPISSLAIMGLWGIRVKSIIKDSDQNAREEVVTNQKFEIKEYVLPRFEVFVEANRDVKQSENSIRLTVYANYTFGEFVNGKATIIAKSFDTYHPDIVYHTTSKALDVEFKRMASFDIKNELKIVNSIRPYKVKFEVTFEETLTGQKMIKTIDVRVHKIGENTLELVSIDKRFKPGFPFKFEAIVRDSGGVLSTDKFTQVKVNAKYYYKPILCSGKDDSLIKELDYTKHEKLKYGVAKFTLIPAANTTSIAITAEFQDAKEFLNVAKHESRSREYLSIKSLTQKSKQKIDKKIKIEVQGNGEWESLNVVVIGRTGVVYNKKYELLMDEIDSKKMKFEFVLSKWMAPSAHVIVYYIQNFGEIVYDRLKIELAISTSNTLDLKVSTEKAKPGEKLSIHCSAAEKSFVSLLGVDQSVTLLGSGNDIDKPRIAADMNHYNAHENYPELKVKGSAENRYSEFGESNAFILTNAQDGKKTCMFQVRNDEGKVIEKDDSDDSGLDFNGDEKFVGDPNKIRTNFPETWIFKDFEVGNDGKYEFKTNIPDTITSFIVTGFAVHPEKGLAIASKKKVTVFQDFFLKLYLPYSVRLGEILKVDVSVFNYINRPRRAVEVKVEMFNNDGEFEFIDAKKVGSDCVKTVSKGIVKSQTINVPEDSGASTFFLIKPLVTGQIKISVNVSTSNRKDAVERMMLVEHEGLTIRGNKASLLKAKEGYDSVHFNIPIVTNPDQIVGDSISIEASVVGDLMGPAHHNIHNLLEKPSGCGEQHFKRWIPNVAVMKYLKAINKLSNSDRNRGIGHVNIGVQNLNNYRKSDGSFSFWGETADSSVWLTAYVAKLLSYAVGYGNINAKYITDALSYVSQKQKPDGNFVAPANFYYDVKSSSQTGHSLTAFCAIAFMESKEFVSYERFKPVVDKAINFISKSTATLTDNLEIAISAYALALAKNDTTGFLDELKKNAFQSDGKMYWYRDSQSLSGSVSQAVNVEIAAYAIMAFVEHGKPIEAVPIMNWLMTQRNEKGGFYSTTDTVIGLQALAKIAAALHVPSVSMEVKLTYGNDQQKIFNINQNTAMILQTQMLEKNARSVGFNANGTGYATVQVSYRYNVVLGTPNERFSLTAVPTLTGSNLKLQICASFVPHESITNSAMTLVEAVLPSGYVYNPQTFEMVKNVGVRKVETEKQKTIVVLYFDSFTSARTCFSVLAIRQNVVTELKNSVVKIYDYYNTDGRATAFYSIEKDKNC